MQHHAQRTGRFCADPSPGQATRSMRAGTCLCQGVPAMGSRSALAVSSLGATPTTPSAPSRPVPLGNETWPGRIVGVTSTTATALPRRVVTRTRSPSLTPSARASSGHRRRAP